MTREEAKEKLYMEWQKFIEDNIDYAGISEAYKTAFKALEQEPICPSHGIDCEDCPAYCDRNICIQNEYNGIGCDECEVTKRQEPCEDAISRQAAIEKIHWLGLDNDTAIKCDLAIRALPSVNPQPKTGWIPVSEKLPKESDGIVLITVNGEVRTGQYSEFSNTWYKGDMGGVGGDDPIAWMHLPEPYTVESEEQA